tara:strand:+ start:1292 stop:1600 length:309 start_codon:yes stop_codon:yes gene_type:complete
MYNLTEDQIQKILTTYKNKKKRESDYYHNSQKHNEDFIKKNRERAKIHYANNKDKKKEKYMENADLLKARSLHRYYTKKDTLDQFETKHPEKVSLLKSKGLY